MKKKSTIISGFLAVVSMLFAFGSYVFVAPKIVTSISLMLSILFNILFFTVNFATIKTASGKRNTRLATNSLLMVLLVICIVILINILAIRHDKGWDFTSTGKFTLSAQTEQILKNLKNKVEVAVFYPAYFTSLITTADDLLKGYAYNSQMVTYRFIDPDKRPDLARRYNVAGYEAVVVSSGERSVTVKKRLTEKELTNAILKATRKKLHKVFFTTGHGERNIEGPEPDYEIIANEMTAAGLELASLNILHGGIPEDTSLVVLAGPVRPFTKEENELLIQYFESGGRLLFMIDPFTTHGLEQVFKRIGVTFGNDLIYDLESRVSGAGFNTPVISTYIEHEITENFGLTTTFPGARSVTKNQAEPDDTNFRGLLLTGDGSWARFNNEINSLEFNPTFDKRGPVTIAGAITARSPSIKHRPPRAIAIGDSDFVTNMQIATLGNKDLFLNIVDWLLESETSSIRPKEKKLASLVFESKQVSLLFYCIVIALPLTIALIGVIVWLRRKGL